VVREVWFVSDAASSSVQRDAVHQPGDTLATMRHGMLRCLLCDHQTEYIARPTTIAGEVTRAKCYTCGFVATHVVEHVFVPSEDLDTLGRDLDPDDPLPERRPMQQYRLEDEEWFVDRCRWCGRVPDGVDDPATAERDHDE
jgi:hypothetical protein